jgi:hypothetical protein
MVTRTGTNDDDGDAEYEKMTIAGAGMLPRTMSRTIDGDDDGSEDNDDEDDDTTTTTTFYSL